MPNGNPYEVLGIATREMPRDREAMLNVVYHAAMRIMESPLGIVAASFERIGDAVDLIMAHVNVFDRDII